MALIDAVDSYFNAIVLQMATVDSTQKFAGYINARDWPLTPPLTNGELYLLFLNAIELRGGTEAQTQFELQCQWVWIMTGTDIQSTQQAENRGDRFRRHMQVIANLNQANFPCWCQKKAYAADAQGNVSSVPVRSVYPVSNVESVTWSRLRFMPKQDNEKSGLIYGACQVSLYCWDDVLPALATADPANPVYQY